MANTFKNYVNAGVGTSGVDVYTAGAGVQATIIGMSIANITANNVTADVKVTAGGVTVYVVKGALIPAGGALVPIGGDQKVVLEAGDKITVVSDTVSGLDVLVSVLEIA
jgi:redox-sensitive bicupin YhaK (pirin superfamily)